MSIFKESFKNFVRKQIKIREAIISHGNRPEEFRTKTPVVDLSNLGGPKNLTLPSHAFYTNTLNRQCTIRMSSGVDLREDNELIVDNRDTFERKDDLVNEGLALRYVLEGGIPMIDRSVQQTSKEEPSGDITTTTRATIRQAPRSGFTGASKNRFGQVYGDPTIRANSGDDYGIVPMPGIKDATVRTKSAYGSLREAQVNFVCHNTKQLEILEILYMRPGYPVLLEWGWTPFIDNDGERRSDFPYVMEWWDQNSTQEVINDLIFKRRVETGGNYDALQGIVKNFNYSARPDGGYDCTTELTGVGEVIQALKGRSDILDEDGKYVTALEKFFDGLKAFSKYKDTTTKDTDENFIENAYSWTKSKILSAAEAYLGYKPPTDVFDFLHLDWVTTHENIPGVYEDYKKQDDTELRTKVLESFMLRKDQDLITEYDPEEDEQVPSVKSKSVYIRLDFFMHALNTHILEKNQNGDSPIVYIKTDTIVNEDRDVIDDPNSNNSISLEGKHIQPLAFTCNKLSPRLKTEFKKLYNDAVNPERVNKWFEFGNEKLEPYYGKDGAKSINDALDNLKKLMGSDDVVMAGFKSFDDLIEFDYLDMSIDPTICLLPHQMKFLKKKGLNKDIPAFFKRVQPQFAYDGVGNPKATNKNSKYDDFIKLCNYDISRNLPGIYERQIGHIFLNVDHLLRVYKSMRYKTEKMDSKKVTLANLDFNIFDYIKKILDDINDSCGGQHRFELQTDNDRSTNLRIVDLIFQPEEKINTEIKEGKIIELNIQSNKSIFRDFQYTSTVPSSLMATIGVVAQNPDSIDSLEQSTFSALNVNVRNRFAQPMGSPEKSRALSGLELETLQIKEEQRLKATIAAEQAENTAFDISLIETFVAYINLKVFYKNVLKGEYSKTDSDGNPVASEEIARQKTNLKTIINQINKLETRHLDDGKYEDGNDFKRGDVKRAPTQGVSDIVPLKFNGIMDGIGGIVIGSTFKIDPSRLPIVYRKTKGRQILFICMTEEQSITAGQDWTTSISGQLTIIGEDAETQSTGAKEGDGSGGGSVGTGNGDASSGGSSSVKKNKVASTKPSSRTIDDPLPAEEEKSQEEKQLDKQDQCPPGYYFDEVVGDCVLEDVVIEEEQESSKEAKAKERYDKWREQAIKYADSLNGMDAYAQTVFEETRLAFGKLSSNQSYTVFYAYFENAISNAQSIKNLSTWNGQNIGPELVKLANEEYDRDPKGIKLQNTNAIEGLNIIAINAEEVHNAADSKNAEALRRKMLNTTNFGLQTINDSKIAGTFKANTANEESILKYRSYYGGEISEPAQDDTKPSNFVEEYRSINILDISDQVLGDETVYEAGEKPNQYTSLQEYVYDDLYGETYSTITEIKEEIDILIEDWEDETGETANV